MLNRSKQPLPRLVLLFTIAPLVVLLSIGTIGYFKTKNSIINLEHMLAAHRPLTTSIHNFDASLAMAKSLINENLINSNLSPSIAEKSITVITRDIESLRNQYDKTEIFSQIDLKHLTRASYFFNKALEFKAADPNDEAYINYKNLSFNSLDKLNNELNAVIDEYNNTKLIYDLKSVREKLLKLKTKFNQVYAQSIDYEKYVFQYLTNSKNTIEHIRNHAHHLGGESDLDNEVDVLEEQVDSIILIAAQLYSSVEPHDIDSDSLTLIRSKLAGNSSHVFIEAILECILKSGRELISDISGQNKLLTKWLLFSIGIAFILNFILLNLLHVRGSMMIEATKALSRGELLHRISMPTQDFMQKMAESYNEMAKSLYDNNNKVNEYNKELSDARSALELKVKQRTQQLEESQKQLEELAFYDSLTGLPNRTLFYERVGRQIVSNRRSSDKLAVMFIDLDKFKLVNDTYGHNVGDELLIAVAKRLHTCFQRESDTVARLGGDEFTVLLPYVNSLDCCVHMAKVVLEKFDEPIVLGALSIKTSPSIGIAISDEDDIHSLMKKADAAMYQAKMDGRNQYCIFDSCMEQAVRDELSFRSAFNEAIANGEFEVFYQPKVDLTSGKVHSFEALLRWRHSTMGVITPDRFIPIAEESGDIVKLGEWVLRTACHQIKQWQEKYDLPIGIAINLSPVQLNDPLLHTKVQTILEETGLDPECLELEITEQSAVFDLKRTNAALDKLHGLGLSIALDDFGTGYASLGYLKSLPIDTLKVDRCFIAELHEDEWSQAIVTAVVLLSKQLGVNLVGEGVENKEQLTLLHELGFDLCQGYYLGMPLSQGGAEERLAQESSAQLCA